MHSALFRVRLLLIATQRALSRMLRVPKTPSNRRVCNLNITHVLPRKGAIVKRHATDYYIFFIYFMFGLQFTLKNYIIIISLVDP